ncbi:hypothetical protein F2P81_025386 [Scophthalmus maximus]|uniref:Uncharacterized protein n=1 Tax=Scophthalmus maximus TaxID=52904 RepID=A0A6A4RSL7_SCOMX|nr:hypothetical protein F2P81_025386 [Scophthalmus maximus]
MRFNPDATVWVAKQRILCTLNQSLQDVLNYGLFQPASDGRDGKFLDEERTLREYPQPISKGVPCLEFRYKSRVYRQPSVDEKQIAKLHTKTLLELGASPDYKDSRGLTPLYHSAVVGGDPGCCELLLSHHASVCCQDENGWHEVHQHLEHLLFYGADMSAQNASGNSALHICALYNQDNCARVLLVRGADKDVKNYNSQSPFQVAIIAGNFELAELIKNHRETDIALGPLAASTSELRLRAHHSSHGQHVDTPPLTPVHLRVAGLNGGNDDDRPPPSDAPDSTDLFSNTHFSFDAAPTFDWITRLSWRLVTMLAPLLFINTSVEREGELDSVDQPEEVRTDHQSPDQSSINHQQ